LIIQTGGYEFESHSKYECIYSFILCLGFHVQTEALRWTDAPLKDSHNFIKDSVSEVDSEMEQY
jgi:hypothetical protein